MLTDSAFFGINVNETPGLTLAAPLVKLTDCDVPILTPSTVGSDPSGAAFGPENVNVLFPANEVDVAPEPSMPTIFNSSVSPAFREAVL